MMAPVSAASTTAAPPSASLGRAGARAEAGAAQRPRPWTWLVLGCLALGVLSLVGPSEPTYDPWSWIIWGREITELDLDTLRGPSWKPLPVLFTTPFALTGAAVAPLLWLVVARAGGLLAVAMAYRLAARFAGRAAGIIAAGSLLLADEFVRNFWRGNSEGLLVALCLWAVERHLDGRRAAAFVLGLGAALLRPEVWPFFGLYGLWLAWAQPQRRVLVAACFVLNGALWFLPEWWGSGDPLRAANRARQPNPDSAAFAAHPFLEVFGRSASVLSAPVVVGALLVTVMAARGRRMNVRLALGLAALVLMIAVAAMTQAGFAGNLRYVALPAALVCVLAGVGWAEMVHELRGRVRRGRVLALAAVLGALAAPFVISDVRELARGTQRVQEEADFYSVVPGLIARAGGVQAVKSCGTVFTGPFQVPAIAWRLHMHAGLVQIASHPPGIIIAPRYTTMSRDRRFPRVAGTREWVLRRRCAA